MTSSIIKEKRKEYIFKSFQSKGEFFFEKDKKKSFNFFFETPPIFEEKLLVERLVYFIKKELKKELFKKVICSFLVEDTLIFLLLFSETFGKGVALMDLFGPPPVNAVSSLNDETSSPVTNQDSELL